MGSFEHVTPPQVDGWALVDHIVPISIGDWRWGVAGIYMSLALPGDLVSRCVG